MLVLRAYINENQIDVVTVTNIGHNKGSTYAYRVTDSEHTVIIRHDRNKGWKKLATTALEWLDRRDTQ